MKLSKKKVFVLALAVCLIATLSMGSLAWFTHTDSVTNDFQIAGSENQNPDEVFSIDVWEKADPNGTDKLDSITYPAILPGDDLYKEVNIENTGAYDQYVRATVTVSDAHVWQNIFGEVYIPLNKIADDLNENFVTNSIVFNADEDTLTYVLYYNAILPFEGEDVVTLLTNVHIPEEMDRYQAAQMAGGFVIDVVADAVQTENVGETALEAFTTVGMAEVAGNSTVMTTAAGLKNVLLAGVLDTVTLTEDFANTTINLDYDVADVTIDANGMNVAFVVTGVAENVVFTNINDTDVTGVNIDLRYAKGGTVTVKDSALVSGKGTGNMAIGLSGSCDLVVDNCQFTSDNGNGYAMYRTSGCASLTVTNSTFTGFVNDWVIMANGTTTGNILIDGCTFTDCGDGIFKTSVGGGGLNGLLNGDFTFTNNTLTNVAGHDKSEAKLFTVKVAGAITVDGNTRDGAEWIPGADQGIVQW